MFANVGVGKILKKMKCQVSIFMSQGFKVKQRVRVTCVSYIVLNMVRNHHVGQNFINDTMLYNWDFLDPFHCPYRNKNHKAKLASHCYHYIIYKRESKYLTSSSGTRVKLPTLVSMQGYVQNLKNRSRIQHDQEVKQ